MESTTGQIASPKKRSRLGCVSCKRSKVKCDELHPSCTRCTKRGTKCLYPLNVTLQTPGKKKLYGSFKYKANAKFHDMTSKVTKRHGTEKTSSAEKDRNIDDQLKQHSNEGDSRKRPGSEVIRTLIEKNEADPLIIDDFSKVVKIKSKH